MEKRKPCPRVSRHLRAHLAEDSRPSLVFQGGIIAHLLVPLVWALVQVSLAVLTNQFSAPASAR